ncbi:MAG: hypothetical protein JOZ92_09100 [Candidatus Dormibacteraeota bacterium]|nr:hypothetical protein [Candidatus Dormibacteraeota bacterium]
MASTPELGVAGRRRNPLPEGTLSVAVGLVLGGIAQYAFLVVAGRALGATRANPLSVFWSLIFVLGTGIFLPFEQVIGRALSARRAHGEGGRPLVLRASVAGLALLSPLVVIGVVLHSWLASVFFNGDALFVWAMLLGLAAFLAEFLGRGTLLGNAAFGRYGLLIGAEGGFRILLCAALAVAGVKVAGLYGFAFVVASLLATLIAVSGRRGLLRPGPRASWSELSQALTYLLVASVCTQFLLSIGTAAVQVLATPSQHAAASRFLATRIIAFIPIFLLQAVQAPLLSKLTVLHTERRFTEFRSALVQMLAVVLSFGGLAVAGLALLGPVAARILFGGGFDLGNLDFALLGGACAVFMVAQVLNQTLIALNGFPRATAGWVTGVVAFLVVTALGSSLFLRVELGLLAGAVATVAVMVVLILPLLRREAVAASRSGERVLSRPAVPEL